MKLKYVLVMVFMLTFLPGCITPGKPTQPEIKKVSVWWGTKEEVKAFLESPEAQSERWMVESIGE